MESFSVSITDKDAASFIRQAALAESYGLFVSLHTLKTEL